MNHEPKEASLRIIGVSAAVIAVLVAFSIGASGWIYHARYAEPHATASAGRQTSFTHGPRMKPSIVQDYEAVGRAAAENLNDYGWVDRQAGVARIPIDRAMELLASGVKPPPAPKEPGQVP